MRRTVLVRALVALAILALAQVSLLVATERSAATMTAAAAAFVDSLSTEQRHHAVFPYADAERLRWHFIPNEMFPRKGVAFRTMSPAQKDKAHALLKSGLSQKGYLTATAIIDLEDTLRAIENSPRFARSPLDYQFTVFGTPGRARHVGLARRGPSPVAALRGGQRPRRRDLADLHRVESRPPSRTARRRACGCWRRSRTPAARVVEALTAEQRATAVVDRRSPRPTSSRATRTTSARWRRRASAVGR